jgi:hypothetical protein
MEVTVHERVPGDLVLKVMQRLNLQRDEYKLTWYLVTVPYPLPAQCFTILSEMHRDFSLTLYVMYKAASFGDIRSSEMTNSLSFSLFVCVSPLKIRPINSPETSVYLLPT